MKQAAEDTIAAIATPLGEGGVGIIRISGNKAKKIFKKLFAPSNGSKAESHKMVHGWIRQPRSKEKIDQALACYMQAPKTFTGEDVVEFYCHGGVALLQKTLKLALDADARLAQRGEFTKRAFLNRKLDLTQAEGVLDLVKAQTESGAGYAVKQLEGRLSKAVDSIRVGLLRILAELEASIDFSDDLPEPNARRISAEIGKAVKEISGLLKTAEASRIYRQGLSVVIAGKPNVGKSSLLNAILGDNRAIVTEIPGTTRDTIEEAVNLKGFPVKLVDTAGIRKPKDKAEEFGVKMAKNEIDSSDFVLVVLDSSDRIDGLDRQALEMARGQKPLIALNKSDLKPRISPKAIKSFANGLPVYKTSATKGTGIAQLMSGIASHAGLDRYSAGKSSILVNARHRECLERAKKALNKALESCGKGMPADFITIDLKAAILALGEVTGEVVSEEVINMIFDQFCVGK
jgi:tRNA modification GTPase